MCARSGWPKFVSLKACSPSPTSRPPLILTLFTVCFFIQGKNSYWIPSDLSVSHYDVWCYPNQMNLVFSTAWERRRHKTAVHVLKTCLFGPVRGPNFSVLSTPVSFSWSNGFRQNNSRRMICPSQSPHLKSGRNLRSTHNLLHEQEWSGKNGLRLRNSKCPNS